VTEKNPPGRLFIFGGLPGVGKSELARYLSRRLGAAYLRIDTIEQTLRDTGQANIGPEGYVIAYNVAADNLRLGVDVVADSVNPLQVTRKAWRDVARQASARFHEIEVTCTDTAEHQRRVTMRKRGAPELPLPTWQDVLDRKYEPRANERVVIDTAGEAPAESKRQLVQALFEAGVRIG
jgi:predicted kinase